MMNIQVNCPTCSKEIKWSKEETWRPFCSERCKLIDLGEWADETHRIPGPSTSLEDSFDRNLSDD